MKSLKKVVLMGMSTVMLAGLLTACGDDTSEIGILNKQIEGLQAQNKSLTAQLKGMAVTEVAVDSSLRTVAGSNVPTFETIDGLINFPNKLELPNSKDDINNSNVMVGSRFKFNPSANWLMTLDGVNLKLSHPSKIWGSIKSVTIKDIIPEDNMKPLLQGFFKDFPATTIKYRKAYLDDRVSGMIASASIEVDKKKYVVNVGFVERGENAILLLFANEQTDQVVQQELIDLLVRTGSYGESKIKLE